MHFMKVFYSRTIKYKMINKFTYSKQKKLPKLQKIFFTFNLKKTDIKKLLSSLLVFELVVNQKGTFIISKSSNISIKIYKTNFIGCKLTIKKQNLLKIFFNILFNILIKQKHLDKTKINIGIQKNNISYTIVDSIKILNLEKYYYFFNSIPKLNITIITNTKNIKEINFFFKLFKFL